MIIFHPSALEEPDFFVQAGRMRTFIPHMLEGAIGVRTTILL
jgi:hypothetical protein